MDGLKFNVCVFPCATVDGKRMIQTVINKEGELSCVAGRVTEGEVEQFEERCFEMAARRLSGVERNEELRRRTFDMVPVNRGSCGIPERDPSCRTELLVMYLGSLSREQVDLLDSNGKKSFVWRDLDELVDSMEVDESDDGWKVVRVREGDGSEVFVRTTSYVVMKAVRDGLLYSFMWKFV